MALSNKERVGRVLDTLREGLLPFILREYHSHYGGEYIAEISNVIGNTDILSAPTDKMSSILSAPTDKMSSIQKVLDTHACLHLMWRRWNDVFQNKLGHTGRSYVSEMIQARNDWAHTGKFDNDQAYRITDTAARLLKMISAGDEAARIEEISRDLLRLRFEAEADRARRESVAQTVETTTLAGLRPWRAVVQPHPDVASGRYIQAEFAADLSQVLAGTAEREYQDPVEFFRRTYLTEGLLALLVNGVQRLTAQGGDPVVQLQTSFGGGKTHSMLALYHLTQGKLRLPDVPGGERLAAQIGNVDLPEANIAVLVGTALDPTKPRQYPDATVNTLWGEMAYQIGGRKAYDLLAQADQTGVSPGSNTLHDLLFQFGPCLIIVDELVAYARNLYGAGRLPGGTFDSVMTFIQALTEAVRRSQESMMLISIPESNIEIGGEAGKKTLDTLAHIVGRMEAVWKPVTATESFEIIRRRLFATEVDYAARDAVVTAFGDMYRNATAEFPARVAERDYLERMRAAYPIHPEMFDRLFEDWSTLENFQRTRGVLRLMAAVIHQLWTRGDQSLFILPGTLPLDAAPVRNEILRYLPTTWAAVFDGEIDGPQSDPLHLDGQVPALGRYSANRRVARTVFIGSAPSVAGQRVRGLEEVRIRLGCAQPGEPTAVFGDALRRMSSQLAYLYTDGSRYWYDTHPTVTKLARDRASGFPLAEVDAEIIERLRKVSKNRDFASHHVAPADTSDVADEDRARVVVLRPEHAHKRSNGGTPAQLAVRRFLESRGNAQRLYKNMLIFIAPDVEDVEALRQAARDFLAWRSIKDDEEALNLDAQQRRQVKTSLDKADETTGLRLRAAYNWLLVPVQPDPLGALELQASRISGDDNFYDRAARKLRNDGLLINEWSPDILRMELDKYIWNAARGYEVRLQQLWEYLAQYCYLPRLFDQNVLLQAVKRGVERLDAPFAYAAGKHPNGHHTGLVFRHLGQVYFDAQSLMVHPDHIALPPEIQPAGPGRDASDPVSPGTSRDASDPGAAGKPDTSLSPTTQTGTPVPSAATETPSSLMARKPLTRYHGHVVIDPLRAQKEAALIIEEVVQRLTSLLGTEVEITLEISAQKPDGFDESTVRTISENSRTLKFEGFGFEEG